jgi:NADPH:quinone reductase-like Zn-dependent oxidoreductase
MSSPTGRTGLQLRSRVKSDGELDVSLVEKTLPAPAADEIVICVEATPINPSTWACCSAPPTCRRLKASGDGAKRPW